MINGLVSFSTVGVKDGCVYLLFTFCVLILEHLFQLVLIKTHVCSAIAHPVRTSFLYICMKEISGIRLYFYIQCRKKRSFRLRLTEHVSPEWAHCLPGTGCTFTQFGAVLKSHGSFKRQGNCIFCIVSYLGLLKSSRNSFTSGKTGDDRASSTLLRKTWVQGNGHRESIVSPTFLPVCVLNSETCVRLSALL